MISATIAKTHFSPIQFILNLFLPTSCTVKHYFFFQENQKYCTSVSDLIKDTPLMDRERDTVKEREEKKAQHLMGLEHLTSLS